MTNFHAEDNLVGLYIHVVRMRLSEVSRPMYVEVSVLTRRGVSMLEYLLVYGGRGSHFVYSSAKGQQTCT